MNKNNFYITTPIYYPNAQPHIGTLYSTLIADVFAKWKKLHGKNIFLLTGTDEHGQKIQASAHAANKEPQEFVDSIIPVFKKIWDTYGIAYNRFIRTTDDDHVRGVQLWIETLLNQGDIYKSNYIGWYCIGCEAFMTIASDAEKDIDGRYICSIHKKQLQELAEESYFFRLSAYQDQLLAFYAQHPDFITPKERLQEVISFVKSGLNDLSLSRTTVTWGIPFPNDPAHTVYVWADALNNYITGIGYGNDTKTADFNTWWPADVQVMAKDIVRFHAVYWPAFLIAANIALPKKLLVHGYILMDDQKMSKSLGNACDPLKLAHEYGVDQVRYYLLRQMAVTHDGHFSLSDLAERVTADLANNLGNLLNRTTKLALANNLIYVDGIANPSDATMVLKHHCLEAYRLYTDEMDHYSIHLALAEVFKFVSQVNAYFHMQKPWVLAKSNPALFNEIISAVCQSLYYIAIMLWPVMPTKMVQLLNVLGITAIDDINYDTELRDCKWDRKFVLSQSHEPLFTKIEYMHTVPAAEVTQAISIKESLSLHIAIDDFAKIELTTGLIIDCQPVPNSNKLLKLQVDCGSIGKRQILSGIAQSCKPEEIIGRQGVFVTNLKPRMMLGFESHGMMLTVQDSVGKVTPVTVSEVIKPGTPVK